MALLRPTGPRRGNPSEEAGNWAASRVATVHHPKLAPRRRWSPYLFCLPFALLFAAFFLAPIAYALFLSFNTLRRSGLGLSAPVQHFSGLANYVLALHDTSLYHSILRVLLLGIVQVPIMLGAALLLSLLLERPVTRLRAVFRTIYFLPYAVPGVIGAILWSFLYYPTLSPFDKLLKDLSAGSPNLLSTHLVLWSIANIITWEWTGYNVVILSAGLQGIPPDIYEAAKVDGAGELQTALRIKIPMVVPALVLTLIFSIVGTLQIFTEPYVLSGFASTINSAYTPVLHIYNTALNEQDPYFGSAIAVILAVVTGVVSFGALRLVHRRSGV